VNGRLVDENRERMLRLKSLGQTLIEIDDARLTPAAETVFATALYLIIETGRPVGRDELTRLFWPGVSEAQAQHGLRQTLYKLKSLGATIKADRAALILSPRSCSTDFAALLASQTPAALESLASRIGGGFLPGYRPQLSDEFASWVERQRDVVHSALARVLVAGMQAKKRVSDWTGAEQLAALCLTMDPLNEEATLTVAEAAALGGSKTKALSILNHYLEDIGENASAIKLPAVLLRRRISEAYQDNIFPVRDAPFVGREEEMTELTAALARAQSGNGSAHVIWGEPGIGKTRLVQEFTRVAALQRVHIVRVGCQSHDVRRPLSAFVDLVPKLLALPGALGCSPESMQYLRRLTAHDPEEARKREEHEDSNISYASARLALTDVLDAVSNEMCCLVELEDAQWLDAHSIRLMEEIAHWITSRRVLILVTSRKAVLESEDISSLTLRPLPIDSSSAVARAMVKDALDVADDFLTWCVSSSGGNPYYLIELLRNGTTEKAGYRAPTSLTRLLENRVSLLSADARGVLEVCCILGKHSSMERIESCIQVSRVTVLRSLNELETSGMIDFDGSRVLSRHDLLTSVVITNMCGTVKGMLHRYAAAQLENEADNTHSVSLMWEAAEHWLTATDAPRAILLLRRCGNYLMDVGMPDEAARILERAETLAISPAEKYAIAGERIRSLMRADRSKEAAELIERASLLRRSIFPKPSPLDEIGLMSLQARWDNCDRVTELVSDSLEALSSKFASADQRISAAGWLLTIADNLCDAELARRLHEDISTQLRSPAVATDTRLWFEMVYHASFGQPPRARDLARELIDYATHECSPIIAVKYIRNAAHVLRCNSTPQEALAVAKEAFEITARIHAPKSRAACAGMIASIYMQIGDNSAACEWLTGQHGVSDPTGLTVMDVNLWSYRAELAIRLQDVESAQIAIDRCVKGLMQGQSARSSVRTHALEAQVLCVKGEPIPTSSLDSFLKCFEVTKLSSLQDYSVESLLLALNAVNRREDAVRLARDYVSHFRRDVSPLSVPLGEIIVSLSS
jgi:DNA-binding SARP family transcriptional activator